MIRLENFKIGYGNRILLKDIDVEFRDAALTALIGRNGTGKSTLLRALAGLNRNYSGRILIENCDIKDMSVGKLAKTIAFVTTEKFRIPNLKCEDIVSMGRAPYTNWIGRIQDVDREIVAQSLEAVGMAEYASRTMDTMSDGECQRIMIARALAQTTPVILLDEPTSFLDIPNRYELVNLLHRLTSEQKKTIIFSTHELDVAERFCDMIALVDTPMLHYQSTGEAVKQKIIQNVFGLI